MNKVVLVGRIVREPDVRYSGEVCVAKYTLAVDCNTKDKGADFISCVAFGKSGEFAEKYLSKGMKIALCGRIQTGSYTNKDGKKVYTTDVVVEGHEFVEKKMGSDAPVTSSDGFMSVPDGVEDDFLPFN